VTITSACNLDCPICYTHNNNDSAYHMSEAELIFTALAELSTRQIAERQQATGMAENVTAAKAGGRIAKNARQQLEDQTGQSVVTGANYLPPSSAKPAPLPAAKPRSSGKKNQKP